MCVGLFIVHWAEDSLLRWATKGAAMCLQEGMGRCANVKSKHNTKDEPYCTLLQGGNQWRTNSQGSERGQGAGQLIALTLSKGTAWVSPSTLLSCGITQPWRPWLRRIVPMCLENAARSHPCLLPCARLPPSLTFWGKLSNGLLLIRVNSECPVSTPFPLSANWPGFLIYYVNSLSLCGTVS